MRPEKLITNKYEKRHTLNLGNLGRGEPSGEPTSGGLVAIHQSLPRSLVTIHTKIQQKSTCMAIELDIISISSSFQREEEESRTCRGRR
jgi:hypothetical protein